MTVVPDAGTTPRSTKPLQTVERTIGCVELVQSIGPANTLPRADSVSVPRPDDICLDVGANPGYYSMLMAARAPRGEVHSFEPMRLNWCLLSASALLNGFHHALITAGVIALVGALIAFATLQHARHREEVAPAADFVEAA